MKVRTFISNPIFCSSLVINFPIFVEREIVMWLCDYTKLLSELKCCQKMQPISEHTIGICNTQIACFTVMTSSQPSLTHLKVKVYYKPESIVSEEIVEAHFFKLKLISFSQSPHSYHRLFILQKHYSKNWFTFQISSDNIRVFDIFN